MTDLLKAKDLLEALEAAGIITQQQAEELLATLAKELDDEGQPDD